MYLSKSKIMIVFVILIMMFLTMNNFSQLKPEDEKGEIGRYQVFISDSPAVLQTPGPFDARYNETTPCDCPPMNEDPEMWYLYQIIPHGSPVEDFPSQS